MGAHRRQTRRIEVSVRGDFRPRHLDGPHFGQAEVYLSALVKRRFTSSRTLLDL
jgi:hypothetical protein